MNKGLLLIASAGVLLAYACGADPLYVGESDAVITIAGEGVDYSEYSTYYMPDRIIDLCLQPSGGSPSSDAIGGAAGGPAIDPGNCYATDHTVDEEILEALEANMEALGYERVTTPEDADLALLLGHVSRASWSLSRTYCYPNDYFPGCVSQANNPDVQVPYRSLVVQMIDLEASGQDLLESVWTAAIHQVQRIEVSLGTDLGGGTSDIRADIMTSAIATAFGQSEYLDDGGAN